MQVWGDAVGYMALAVGGLLFGIGLRGLIRAWRRSQWGFPVTRKRR
jgi:hypothetical protein